MIKPTKLIWKSVSTLLLAAGLTVPSAQAQTSEALIDALIRKGILTEQEAEDIKADVSKENREYNKWILGKDAISYRLYGDVRARYEFFRTENESETLGTSVPPNRDRDRFRYRLRAGITATLLDQFEVGFRLTSSEAQGTFGGDPISGNTTFQDNGSKKFVYIDLAYGKWTPITNASYFLSGSIGKIENPFVLSDMVFDADYTPEGVGLQGGYIFNDAHTLKGILGYFILDEINQGGSASDDPFILGGQLRWDANWVTDPAKFPKVQSSAGIAWLLLNETESLGNAAVPNVNAGNTRFGTNLPPRVPTGSSRLGNLANDFAPVVADASVTLTLEKFPMYPGNFPVRFAGEFIHNPRADDNNNGWWAGVFFGRASKKRSWDLSYRYKRLESDAWYEEVVDSDFGAYYPIAPLGTGLGTGPGSGLGAGYRAGTGLQGHIVKVTYALSDSVTLGATWFYVHLIDEPSRSSLPANLDNDSGQHRVQVDASWKF